MAFYFVDTLKRVIDMPTNKDMSEALRLKLDEVIRKSNAQKKLLQKILDQLNLQNREEDHPDNISIDTKSKSDNQ